MDAWVSDYNSLLIELLKDAEFTVVIRSALARFNELPPNDKFRFHLFMSAHLLNAQTMYFQLKDGTFDQQIADQILPFNASMLKTPGGLQWWRGAREVWRPKFVEHMDRLIQDARPITDVWPWFNEGAA
jgi:hypothetical protein